MDEWARTSLPTRKLKREESGLVRDLELGKGGGREESDKKYSGAHAKFLTANRSQRLRPQLITRLATTTTDDDPARDTMRIGGILREVLNNSKCSQLNASGGRGELAPWWWCLLVSLVISGGLRR